MLGRTFAVKLEKTAVFDNLNLKLHFELVMRGIRPMLLLFAAV